VPCRAGATKTQYADYQLLLPNFLAEQSINQENGLQR
jgi:hypothetical protein